MTTAILHKNPLDQDDAMKAKVWNDAYSIAWNRLFSLLSGDEKAQVLAAPSGKISAALGHQAWQEAEHNTSPTSACAIAHPPNKPPSIPSLVSPTNPMFRLTS